MRLGYYVHHQGRGHLHRFLAVRERLGEVTALSSLPRPPGLPVSAWRELPLDVPVDPAQMTSVTADGRLHWAPLGSGGYRTRMARIAGWIASAEPDAVIVDVSVEVAALVRLLGVPIIWVAQRGRRDDPAHRLAYDLAERVILPWTPSLDVDEPGGPPHGRSVHVGAISRFDGRTAIPCEPSTPRRVLVLLGYGGHSIALSDLRAAARATPDWTWELAGQVSETAADGPAPTEPDPLYVHPPGCDVFALLQRARVVVGPASGNVVAEVAAARRPLICLPQARPFDEQGQQARSLDRAGLAEALPGWPAPAQWPALLDRAAARDPGRWSVLHDGHGADRFARAVQATLCA